MSVRVCRGWPYLTAFRVVLWAAATIGNPTEAEQPESDDVALRIARAQSIADHAQSVQEYEAISLIGDCVFGGAAFQMPKEAVLTPSAQLCNEFILEYSEHGEPNAGRYTARTVYGVFGRTAAFSRGECYARTPKWRARGLVYEPIGLTVVQQSEGLDVYQPHLWTKPGAYFSSLEAAASTLGKSPLLAAPDSRAVATIVNDWALRRLCVSKDRINNPTELILTANWPEPKPWFYVARLDRIEFDLEDRKERRTATSARVFGEGIIDPIATISYTYSRNGNALESMAVDVLEPALCRTDEGKELPVALPRRILWRFMTGSSVPSYPSEIRIETFDGQTVMRLGTKLAHSIVLTDEAKDVRVPLHGPPDDCRWTYYLIMRQFFDTRRPHTAESAEAARQYVTPCEDLIRMAVAAKDRDTEIAARRLLSEIWFAVGDRVQWFETWKQFITSARDDFDGTQLWMEYGWTTNYIIRYKWMDKLDVLLEDYAKALATHFKADALLEKGQLSELVSDGYIQSVVSYDALLSIASNSEIKKLALLGKARSLCSLVQDLARKGIPGDKLLVFVDKAAVALSAAEKETATAVPQQKIDDAAAALDLARKVLREK